MISRMMKAIKVARKLLAKASLLAVYLMASMQSSWADDTEIFMSTENENSVKPNVLFIFDTSGSMNRNVSGTNDSRIDVMRDVMTTFITNISNLNIGMARFSVPGGPILNGVVDIDAPVDPIALSTIGSSNDDATERTSGPPSNRVSLDDESIEMTVAGSSDIIGLRFLDLDIPQGAIITQASITFSTYEDSSGATQLTIFGDTDTTPEDFNARAPSARTKTSNSVVWKPDDWKAPEASGDPDNPNPPATYSSPELITIVQEIVNQSDWCGGNSMAFLIEGDNLASRNFITHDASELYAPRIRIEYDTTLPVAANGCFVNQAISQIAESDHDFETIVYRGTNYNYTTGYLDFNRITSRWDSDGVGLHFSQVAIPNGVTIKDAYIEITAHDDDSGRADAIIYPVNSANASSDPNDIVDGPKLGGVAWSMDTFVENIVYPTPSLASQVQTLVNLSGWESGNSMSFYIKASSGNRDGVSWDVNPVRAPRLVVTYVGRYDGSGYTKRDEMKQVVQDFQARGMTPISDTLAEAGLYYRGEEVLYGLERGSPHNRYNRISNPNSFDSSGVVKTPSGCDGSDPNAQACRDEIIEGNPNYLSPIENGCQKNHIVLLTDGAPTWHDRQTTEIYERWSGSTCDSRNSGRDCAIKIAQHLNIRDQADWIGGDQTVQTHTIGFDYDSEFLADLAEAGGGMYETAESKDDLLAALDNIAATVLKTNATFVTAGVTVNQYNKLTHNDELYFSLFEPQATVSWPGNIKRYRLAVTESGEERVVDVSGSLAVDSANGEFIADSQSYWSDVVDGNETAQGGVAGELVVDRNVYTNVTGSSTTSESNQVDPDNDFITKEMLEVGTEAELVKVLKWAQGYDVEGPDPSLPHNKIGDPLHSKPTLLSYQTGTTTDADTGETIPVFESVVFVGTNHGFLHAFDSESGTEKWSFIPKDLLKNLNKVINNGPAGSTGEHIYGLDGTVTLYIDDEDDDGLVDSNEKAYLYIGMRRGGNAYYAFDISNRNAPELMFKIDPNSDPDGKFDNLGQTWSQPVISRLSLPNINTGNNPDKLVMIFGGGYDVAQDAAGTAANNDGEGNRVYIADALSGEWLWDNTEANQATGVGDATSDSAMNSVPGDVKVIDLDSDGFVDHIYAADTRTQIFRFDFTFEEDANGDPEEYQTITGGRIAHLQEGVTAAENRRFFYSPDVSLNRDSVTGQFYFAIAIGSGYRAHPLDLTVNDHFYLIRDKGAIAKTFLEDVTLSDLVNVTNMVGDSDGDGVNDVSEAIVENEKSGWYIELTPAGDDQRGEKILAPSVTLNGRVQFVSYLPPDTDSADECAPAAGTSRAWGMNVENGSPYVDVDGDDLLTGTDRYFNIQGMSGISPEPQVLITSSGQFTQCYGRQCGLDTFLSLPPTSLQPIKWRRLTNEYE